HPVPGHEGERRLAGGVHVLAALVAADPEHQLAPAEAEQVAGGEEVAGGEAAGEVVDRRSAHQRVVDIEEGRAVAPRGSARHGIEPMARSEEPDAPEGAPDVS